MKNQPMIPRPRASRLAAASPQGPASLGVEAPVMEQDIALSYRWLWYLLSIFIPFSGMLIALLLYDQDSREIRKVGRNCLLIAFLVWVIFPLAVLFALLLAGVLAMADFFSDLVSPTD